MELVDINSAVAMPVCVAIFQARTKERARQVIVMYCGHPSSEIGGGGLDKTGYFSDDVWYIDVQYFSDNQNIG